MNYVSRESMKCVQQKTVPNRMTTVHGLLSNEIMNEWMFNDTPARKQIDYWVSEQGYQIKRL